jgi:CHAD domain-containing protein
MAYRFEAGEPVPDAVRRIVREELESAAGQLSRARGAARDEAIHEARKSIKKSRALLRLMQPELERIYETENVRLRDIGLHLSDSRDAAVMLETLLHLEEKYKDEVGIRACAAVRRALARHRRQTERRSGTASLLLRTAAALRAAARRVKSWPLEAEGFAALAEGFECTFRRGRKALAAARKDPTPENDHTLRKRVKDHYYHVRLLGAFADTWLEGYERSLKELETWLGECHNLVVLRQKLRAEPGAYGRADALALVATLIDRHERELRAKALALGARIYGRKARLLVRRVQHLWDVSAAPAAAKTRQARPGRP